MHVFHESKNSFVPLSFTHPSFTPEPVKINVHIAVKAFTQLHFLFLFLYYVSSTYKEPNYCGLYSYRNDIRLLALTILER